MGAIIIRLFSGTSESSLPVRAVLHTAAPADSTDFIPISFRFHSDFIPISFRFYSDFWDHKSTKNASFFTFIGWLQEFAYAVQDPKKGSTRHTKTTAVQARHKKATAIQRPLGIQKPLLSKDHSLVLSAGAAVWSTALKQNENIKQSFMYTFCWREEVTRNPRFPSFGAYTGCINL